MKLFAFPDTVCYGLLFHLGFSFRLHTKITSGYYIYT
jgi:hypothetical protein